MAKEAIKLTLNPRNLKGNPEAVIELSDEDSAKYFIEALKHQRDPVLMWNKSDHINWLMQRAKGTLKFTLSLDIDKMAFTNIGHHENGILTEPKKEKEKFTQIVNSSVFSIVLDLLRNPQEFGRPLLSITPRNLASSLVSRIDAYVLCHENGGKVVEAGVTVATRFVPVGNCFDDKRIEMSIILEDMARIGALVGRDKQFDITICLDSLTELERDHYNDRLKAELEEQPAPTGKVDEVLAVLPNLSLAEREKVMQALKKIQEAQPELTNPSSRGRRASK